MRRHTILFLVVFLWLWCHEASAFWGSDSKGAPSGLNVAAGFDVNTITTLSGTALAPPHRGEGQHTEMPVATNRGTVSVILGPWWYWEKHAIAIQINQELTITGSLAQGKNGALYLFTQRIENRSSGESITLRTESGAPLWSGYGSGSQGGGYQNNGSGSRSGAGNRGGMRGGRR